MCVLGSCSFRILTALIYCLLLHLTLKDAQKITQVRDCKEEVIYQSYSTVVAFADCCFWLVGFGAAVSGLQYCCLASGLGILWCSVKGVFSGVFRVCCVCLQVYVIRVKSMYKTIVSPTPLTGSNAHCLLVWIYLENKYTSCRRWVRDHSYLL